MNIQRLVIAAALAMCLPPAMAAPPAANGSGSYKAKTERGQLSQQIIKKWAGYVSRVYGTDPGSWARSMAGTFAEADVSNMRKAAQKGTYEAMMGNLLGKPVQDEVIIEKMARSNGSMEVVKSLGSDASDLTYNMVAPCRIADTRVAGGRLAAGAVRNFTSSGANFNAQGGAATSCSMPADASAVVVNVTAVTPDGPGFLTLFPFNTTRPTASNLNYKGADIVANEVIVKQTLGQPSDFSVYSLVGTDVVIDVVGYFMAPIATSLDCQTVSSDNVVNAAGTFNDATIECPSSFLTGFYSATGGGCETTGSVDQKVTRTTPTTNGWFCRSYNAGANPLSIKAHARCCRTPGRPTLILIPL